MSARVARNLVTILARAADAFCDREAVRFEGETRSFGDLHGRALQVASGLEAAGVAPGDRVAVLLRNRLEWVELLFGIARLGAVCVPVNVLLRPREVAYVCEDADVRALVVDAAGVGALDELAELPDVVVAVGEAAAEVPDAHTYDDLVREGTAGPHAAAPALDDPLVLYYSSGTTGKPKAAVHTHNTILWNAFHQVPDLGLHSDDTYLVVPSLSWAAGFHDIMLPCMWIGARSVVLPTGGVTISRVAAVAERENATTVLLVPTLLKQLLDDPSAQETLRDSPLRFVLTGAEPVPLAVIEGFMDALPGCQLRQGYGLSEFPTIATLLREQDAVERAGWAGRPTSITHVVVRTDGDEITPVGEGEVLLRSPATMTRYWRRPDETAAAFRDGWLHTGDLGVVDEAGYLRIIGRKKDMIISGGLNVYPAEVEDVVYDFPGVREAAVVGVSDEEWGEVPVAVVVGDLAFDAEALLAHCRDQLATYKVPRRVIVRDEGLPRNTTGKILRRELQPWVEDRTAKERA